MAIDTSIYNNVQNFKLADPMESAQKAMSLKQLGLQQAAAEKQIEREDRDSKLAYAKKIQEQTLPTMEYLAGLPESERAKAYPVEMKKLAAMGVPMNNIPSDQDGNALYDRNSFISSYSALRNSDFGLAREKTKAEINNLNRKGTESDQFSRQVALLNYKDQLEQKKKNDEINRYANVGGWKLSEGATPTLDDAKKFKGGVSSARALLENLGEYQSLLNKTGSEYGGKDAQKLESLARDIQLSAKNEDLYGLGVLTGPDLALLEELIRAPTELSDQFNPWAGAKALNKAEQFREMLNSRINAKAKTYGFEPNEEWKAVASGPNKRNKLSSGSAYADDRVESSGAPDGMILMESPSGQRKFVRIEDKGEAIAAGGKVVK